MKITPKMTNAFLNTFLATEHANISQIDAAAKEALEAVLELPEVRVALLQDVAAEIEQRRQDDIEAGWSEMHAQAAQDSEPF